MAQDEGASVGPLAEASSRERPRESPAREAGPDTPGGSSRRRHRKVESRFPTDPSRAVRRADPASLDKNCRDTTDAVRSEDHASGGYAVDDLLNSPPVDPLARDQLWPQDHRTSNPSTGVEGGTATAGTTLRGKCPDRRTDRTHGRLGVDRLDSDEPHRCSALDPGMTHGLRRRSRGDGKGTNARHNRHRGQRHPRTPTSSLASCSHWPPTGNRSPCKCRLSKATSPSAAHQATSPTAHRAGYRHPPGRHRRRHRHRL